MTPLKYIGVAIAGIVIGLVISAFVFTNAIKSGGIYTQNGQANGPTGTLIKNQQVGTCSLVMGSYTVAATTSVAADCAVTGILAGDIVDGWFNAINANGAGWLVTQASASTTNGFITFRIVNNTGVSAVIPATIASSTNYQSSRI